MGRVLFVVFTSRERSMQFYDSKPYDTIGTFFRRERGNRSEFLRPQFGREIRRQSRNQQLRSILSFQYSVGAAELL